MELYGNKIWHELTPNSEKSLLITEKNKLDAVLAALDSTGVNYCYYIRDDEVTIAFADIFVNKSDTLSLLKLPALKNVQVTAPRSAYTPQKDVIGNTAYRDIANKGFQKLNRDLALKVALELDKNGIRFSGKSYGKTVVLTTDKKDNAELRRIIGEVVGIRREFNRKIGDIELVNSVFDKERQMALSKITDLFLTKERDFAETFMNYIDEIRVFSPRQLSDFSDLFLQTYADLPPSEYFFAKTKPLTEFLRKAANENKAADIAKDKDFSSEQQQAILALIERETGDALLNIIDSDFSPEDILAVDKIMRGKNFFDNLVRHIARIKDMDYWDLYDQLKANSYVPKPKSAVRSNEISEPQIEPMPRDLLISYAVSYLSVLPSVKNAFKNSDRQNFKLEIESGLASYITDLMTSRLEIGDGKARRYTPKEAELTFVSCMKESSFIDEIAKLVSDDIKAEDPREESKEKTFAQQVDEALEGKIPFYSALKVSDTPQILLSVGCKQLPMLYTQKHLKDAIKPKNSKEHTHGLAVEQIKKLDKLIESPLMVIDSLSNGKSIVVVTSEVDKDGLPIMVSVTPNGKGRYELEELDSNFITSVYGRNNFPEFFKRIVENDKLLYCSKKSQDMFERWGEQYSELTNSLDFDIIIHQSRNIVNTEKIEETKQKESESVEKKEQETSAPSAKSFDTPEFERHIPRRMRYKEVHAVNDSEMHWVTQEPFTVTELREFQQAVKDYGCQFKKFYVTPRDLSDYDFEDDKARNVLAVVTPDSIVYDDYVQAIQDIGLGHYIDETAQSQEKNPVQAEQAVKEVLESLEPAIKQNNEQGQAEKQESNNPITDVPAENFRLTDSTVGEGTQLERFKNNLAAIELLKALESDNRQANTEEQETLSKYVGWGGLSEFFKESNPHYAELRALLTEEEYEAARATTTDAFYTTPFVIDNIYTVLKNIGFEGGRILEPSMGIGHFFGRMPQEIQDNSKLFGVEIDSITGRIAKQLYPNANITIKGFEKTSFADNSFDVAVGNVPFGTQGVFDKDYNKYNLRIHDYFFLKALDKVRTGGIVAFVTSSGTLDKQDPTLRKMLADKANLLGAVRLPEGTFSKSANTDVTTDIIFLQKRQSAPEKYPEWVNVGVNAAGLPLNQYYLEHPDMVLGEIIQGNRLYSRSNGTRCVPFENSDLSKLLPEAVSRIKGSCTARAGAKAEPIINSEIPIPESVRNFTIFEHNNDIYIKDGDSAVSLREGWGRYYTQANIARAKAYIGVRDTTRALLAVQQETGEEAERKIKALQEKLNTQYDSFYEKYGLMNSSFNARLFADDVSYPLMRALEDKTDGNKLIRKSDIFFKRTIRPQQIIESADSPQEALAVSLGEKGKVDLDYMADLTAFTKEELIRGLKGEIFPVPESSAEDNIVYQSAAEYLSGDIYAKIERAKLAAESNDIFRDNISALEAVIPTPLTAGDIDIDCGATWIPKELYRQFIYELLGTPSENRADKRSLFPWQSKVRKIDIAYSPYTNQWSVSNKSADRSVNAIRTYGTKDRNAYAIFENLLNLHIPPVTHIVEDEEGNKTRVMDLDGTNLVKKKAEAIQTAFKDWILKDPQRRKELTELYNRQFNCIRPRQYDGSNIQFHGMSASIELHAHQKDAIAHALHGGNALFAHCVGAGKTFEMIATAMEAKRLGLCHKSMFAVPNHLTEHVGADFLKLYPNANILVATKKDFEKKNRSKLLAKIAAGNYDAVIIGHSQLTMIPMSPEKQKQQYKEQIDDITKGIKELKAQRGESFQIKAMERAKKSLQVKLEKLEAAHRDDTMYFEELGVDKLFVDEAHEFKNLLTATKLKNVSGISGRTSQKAMDLFMKCRYLDEQTGGKGVVFATGTPVSNSITELHTMMRYLEYDFLSEHGLQNFDNWVSVFGKQKTDYELAPAGNSFRQKTRIASYANMPELMSMFKQIADVRTSDTLNLPVPECELHVIDVEPTELQKALVNELSDRADAVQNGSVKPWEDNMLKITGDGY